MERKIIVPSEPMPNGCSNIQLANKNWVWSFASSLLMRATCSHWVYVLAVANACSSHQLANKSRVWPFASSLDEVDASTLVFSVSTAWGTVLTEVTQRANSPVEHRQMVQRANIVEPLLGTSWLGCRRVQGVNSEGLEG
jgi:hypothetical protein